MNHLNSIKDKIRKSMFNACDDMLLFTNDPAETINSEYLFTVNAAKSINSLNGYHADPYKILIEFGTKNFARDCLPLTGPSPNSLNKFGSRIVRQERPNVKRNGRIDIAIYIEDRRNYFDRSPLCAIELKGFNPARKLAIADLKRNLEYFHIKGLTGISVVDFTLFASFHSFIEFENDDQILKNEQNVHDKYLKWMSEIGGFNYEVQL